MRFINKIYNTFTSILLFEKCITIFRSKKNTNSKKQTPY